MVFCTVSTLMEVLAPSESNGVLTLQNTMQVGQERAPDTVDDIQPQ